MSNMQPFLLICLLIITVISTLSVLNVNAQSENKSGQLDQTPTNETVGWQSYEDDEDGYKIQYPQEWKTVESNETLLGKKISLHDFQITPDDDNPSALGPAGPTTDVSVNVQNASRTLDPATLKIQSLPLEHYVNELTQGSLQSSGDIVTNEAVTFSGEPAWRVDYIYNYEGSQLFYGSHIFVIKDGKLYEITFATPPLKVEEMLPVGEKIIQTFQFTNNTTKN